MNLMEIIIDLLPFRKTKKNDSANLAETSEKIQMLRRVVRSAEEFNATLTDSNVASNISRALHGNTSHH